MATDHHIKNFTAADIEKYHKGLLSPKERHDLEKAAMDDPFLADALEGYAVAGVDVAADIAALKRRLAEKTEGARVIPMGTAPKNSFRILKAAIVIAFIAGAGLLIYQFGFNKKQGEIAQAETTKKDAGSIADSATPITNIPSATRTAPEPEFKTEKAKDGVVQTENAASGTDKEPKPGNLTGNKGGEAPVGTGKTLDDMTVNKAAESQPIAPPPPASVTKEGKTAAVPTEDKLADKKELAREEAVKNNANANRQKNEINTLKDEAKQEATRSAAVPRRANEPVTRADNYRDQNQSSNLFRGRVTDADNNGVPFANVTNIQDNNAGTYTDANGYFDLTYPDSVLTVQVRSIGFESNNVQLRNSVNTNKVILQDDRKSLSEVVLSRQQPNTVARKRDANMKLEEPEPADGWEKYDTYLTNNLAVPEDLKRKADGGGEVQVSFEVDKNGEPSNIKVEKSLCSKCDQEAIRLVKEGPKWKRKAKKGRTTVTIQF